MGLPSEPVDGRSPGLSVAGDPLAKGRTALDAALLTETDPTLAVRIGAEVAGNGDPRSIAIRVLRDLLAVETRPDRFRRLLRMWADEVRAAVERNDFAAADAWVGALLTAPTYPRGLDGVVATAIDELATDEVLEDLVVRVTESGDAPGAAGLIGGLGPWMVPYLIRQMAADEPVVHRRRLIEYLGWVGRRDVRLLSARVADPRWFIVRNVAIALGRTGRATAVCALAGLTGHADERVRVEALRSLAALDREETVDRIAASLGDAASRVRHAALSLLRANPSPRVVPALVAAVDRKGLDAATARRIVAVLAERVGPEAVAALRTVAGRRSPVGAGRAARDAARRALRDREAG